ncbi:hypothetical protein GX830_03205 [Candidatus Dojkabacteria bacterium]|nr:hypothetical protein [Candidatus Dojkabacteria bacterium]
MSPYIYSIILIVIIVIFTTIYGKKRMNEEWKGELIKKRKDFTDENSIDTYTLVFKTEDGRKKRTKINSLSDFNNWNIGDKVEKKKGEYHPRKV